MEIKRYWDSSYEELIEAEKKLHKQMQWLNSGKYRLIFPIWNKLEPGAEMLNHAWKKPYYWNIPKPFMNLSLRSDYPGTYEYSLHVRHNEDFIEFLQNGEFKDRVQELFNEPKQQLLLKKIERRNKVDDSNTDLRKELTNLQTHLIFFIEDRAVEVKKYEPHYMGSEDGRNTHKMIELVDGVLFAYRGVMCGSIYAYEYLLANYIFEEKIFDDLRNITDQLVEECKEYLAIQMAVEHHKSNAGADRKATDEELIPLILKCVESETIKVIAKEYSFLTKAKRKVKHTPIAQYIYYETEMFHRYDDYRILVDRVKYLLPYIDGLTKEENNYYKK